MVQGSSERMTVTVLESGNFICILGTSIRKCCLRKAMSDYSNVTVGILALQGDFERHAHQLEILGAKVVEVRVAEQLETIDGLIIPGGESTTMDILIDRFRLRTPLQTFGNTKPLWGTCAGMILLAKKIEDNQAGITPLGLLDIDVVRNGYGRQVHSFETPLPAKLGGTDVTLNATFIRAPRITRVGKNVKSLAYYEDSPVLVTERTIMASSFHTELDDDTTLMAYFLDKTLAARAQS